MTVSSVTVVEADLENPRHADAVIAMIDAYAADPMGGGAPLTGAVKSGLIPGLRSTPCAAVFLAYDGKMPIGVAVCFRGFSTFAARPLLNIHDLAVIPTARKRGAGSKLLEAVEAKARELGCCRLTLEVRRDNSTARALYARIGFHGGPPENADAHYDFWTKDLAAEPDPVSP